MPRSLKIYCEKRRIKLNQPGKMLNIILKQEKLIGDLIEGLLEVRIEEKTSPFQKINWNKTN